MNGRDTLVRKSHRRGARRRQKLRFALQLVLSAILLGASVALSAGVVRVIERPIAPWEQEAEHEWLDGGGDRAGSGSEEAPRDAPRER